ncbi:MAG TPA: Ig domain-containing protein, partial [Vicinamibacterales bacterium]|nr:Ig domain-containing protein [Vicinamibacterales bacterium]
SLPPGLILNISTGAITGMPSAAGTYSFTLKVTDSTGAIAYSSCTASCGIVGSTVFNFDSPLGALGTSQTYTVGGLTITAYGYTNSGTAVELNAKNMGGDEFGVGINGAAEEEIDPNHFVQLDLSQLEAAGVTNPQMMISSIQAGEGYNVYGSNTLGSLGTKLVSAGTMDVTLFTIPGYPTYRYIAVQASSGNVDIAKVSAVAGSCSIAIAPGPLAVTCASGSATVATPYSSAVTVAGGVQPYTFAVTSGALPTGLILNTSTGAITGTPSSSGIAAYSIKVSDATGTSLTTNCSMTVTASGGTLYLTGPTSLSLIPGSGETSNTIPADNGTNYDGKPTNYITFTITGITGTYNGASTGFDLYLDSGTAIGNGIQLEVLYDFTGSGVYGRTEIYHYFAADNRVGWELYSPTNKVQNNGLKSSTGTFANMNNGTVTIRLWNAIGKNPANVSVSARASQGAQSIIVVPFNGVQ